VRSPQQAFQRLALSPSEARRERPTEREHHCGGAEKHEQEEEREGWSAPRIEKPDCKNAA